MVKVITYGTYDLLHYGHIRLLERAKALGDYPARETMPRWSPLSGRRLSFPTSTTDEAS